MNPVTQQTDFFRKPEGICHFFPEAESIRTPEAIAAFITRRKQEIESKVAAIGLRIRMANVKETGKIKRIIDSLFPEKVSEQLCQYDVYRYTRFGYSVVMEDRNGEIAACKLAMGFDEVSGVSHSFLSLVVPAWNGHSLAYLISLYSCLIAMERGSRIRRATVNPMNYASVISLVNKLGFVCMDFHPDFFGKDQPRFIMSLPLTPAGLSNNSISLEKTAHFIRNATPSKDFMLVPAHAVKALHDMYLHSPFRVVGMIPGSDPKGPHQMLALPESVLNFSREEDVFTQTGPWDE